MPWPQPSGKLCPQERWNESRGQRLSPQHLFRDARTHTAWLDKPVDDALLRQVYDLARMGPTSANMCPMRDRLREIEGGEGEAEAAPSTRATWTRPWRRPSTAIIGMDVRFYEKMPKLFPHADAKAWFKDLPENVLEYIALRNSSLQGRVLHAGGPVAGAGLRADVRLQQREGGRGVLRRDDGEIQLPVQPRPRRREQAHPRSPRLELRRGVQGGVTRGFRALSPATGHSEQVGHLERASLPILPLPS